MGHIHALRSKRESERAVIGREAAGDAQRRSLFLGEASRLLFSSLHDAMTFERVARLVVPEIGDACVLLLASDGAPHLEIGAVHVDAADPELLRGLIGEILRGPKRDAVPIDLAFRTGVSQLVTRVDDALLLSIAETPEQLRVLRGLGVSSFMAVPLKARDRTLGVLFLCLCQYARGYDEDDLRFAEEFACRAAVAIDHALLFRAEQRARAAAERAAAQALDRARLLGKRVMETQSRMAALVEASDEAILGIRRDSTIESWNAGAERLYGYSAGEIIGHPSSTLVPPGREGEIRELASRCLRGTRVTGFETAHRRKDGTEVEVAVKLSPIRDAAGDLVGFSAVMHDISARRQLHARLAQADRIASLGTLAAGVAHEINNPLAYVIGNLELVADGLEGLPREGLPRGTAGALERVSQATADAQDGAHRVAQIVRDLKMLSRADDTAHEPSDLRAVMDLALRMSSGQTRDRARVVKDYGEVPLVLASETRLVQVFINLVVNAAQAIPDGAAERHEIRVSTGTDAGGRAVVEVRDSGAGISPEIQERIFEPFFTTKPVGVGTGMGLSICRGIVAAHRGEIAVDSEVGKGSVFRVTLPALGIGAAEAPAEISAGAEARQAGAAC